ncbi:hypothetical protein Gorai_000129 [Gossypium raimondii]|uniref:Uncharacterized protein n=1 Tax=Gossypium raimondii TaxID=29730 RepID=A0A7J8PCH9_GOSRA|nr:hypothetical protein [Gossypium raimondii]
MGPFQGILFSFLNLSAMAFMAQLDCLTLLRR